jgi:tetratricopeptide (TPR) repeat protein
VTTRKPTRASLKMRAGTSAGRTVLALVVALAIFFVIALFVVLGSGGGGEPRLVDNPVVAEDVEAAQATYPQVGGTAAEHVRAGQELAAEGSSLSARAAYEEYRKALAKDPDSVEALMGIAAISHILEREEGGFTVQRALAYCDAVSDVHADDPRPHRVRARISMSVKGYSGGVDAWAAVLQRYPDDEEALLEIGRCLMYLGRHDEAADHLNRRSELGVETTAALLLLAENSRRAGHLADALQTLQRIPQEGRRGADAAVATASIFQQVGDEHTAREQVRLALRFDGNHPRALVQDAIHRYQDEGQLDVARENLLRVLERPGIDEMPQLRDEAALHLATVFRLEGALGEAHRYIDPLVAREPQNMPARFQAAKLALAEGRSGETVGPYMMLLEAVDCRDPEPWFLLGQLHVQDENLEGLFTAFLRAVALDEGYAPAYFSLIHALSQYENPDEIRGRVAQLYAQFPERALLEPRDRRYHDPFDLAILAPTLEATAASLAEAEPDEQHHTQLRALVHFHGGARAEADALFDELAEARRGEAIHRDYQGTIALLDSRYGDASARFGDAAEQAPTTALYLYLAGRMLEDEGRLERAEDSYQRLREYHGDHVLALHGEARLRHRLGDADGARALYARAREADESFLPAWRDHLLLDLGRPLAAGTL